MRDAPISGRRARDAPAVQFALGGADGLVRALEGHGDALPAREAAALLFAVRGTPAPLVERLLADVVADDARLQARPDGAIALTAWAARSGTPLETASFTIVDLETTGVGRDARIVEIGAVRVCGLRQVATLERLVDPGVPLPPVITRITGIAPRDLRRAGRVRPALRELLMLAAGSVLVAHNARFDVGMLDRALLALEGRRLALPVLDTVELARRLLAGRLARFDLATLAQRFDTTVRPCHRALPDALATAEVLLALIGRAQERGATTVEDLQALAASAPRRARMRRDLGEGAPPGPGVYVMRDRNGQALYVGKATDLRRRTRSYFGSRKQRPAVEAALLALHRIDAVPLGSELEASLAELALIQAWRPPANARDARPDRYVYLRLGVADAFPSLGLRRSVGDDGALYAGPFRSRRAADEAAHALRDAFGLRACRPRLPTDDGTCMRGALARCHAPCRGAPEAIVYAAAVRRLVAWLEGRGEGAGGAVRERIAGLVRERRFEEAARQHRRRGALESVDVALAAVRRARARTGLLVAPDLDPDAVRVLAVREGRLVDVRSVPRRGDPAAALARPLGALTRGAEPSLASVPPLGPWLAANELDSAMVLMAAFAGAATGVQPVPMLPGASSAQIARRVAGARERVPLREPLPPGRARRWQDLERVEPAA